MVSSHVVLADFALLLYLENEISSKQDFFVELPSEFLLRTRKHDCVILFRREQFVVGRYVAEFQVEVRKVVSS